MAMLHYVVHNVGLDLYAIWHLQEEHTTQAMDNHRGWNIVSHGYANRDDANAELMRLSDNDAEVRSRAEC